VALKRLAARLLFAGALTLFSGGLLTSASQDKKEKVDTDAKTFVKRCNPKIIRKAKLNREAIKFREGEKLKYMPNVSFQITASGEVVGARLKRSSGVRDYDDAALNFVRSTKYNARPGCPVIENEADVIIDIQ
jgi:TonB family protein